MAMKSVYNKKGVKVPGMYEEGGQSMAGMVMDTSSETMEECSEANPGPGCRGRKRRQARNRKQTIRRARSGRGRRYTNRGSKWG